MNQAMRVVDGLCLGVGLILASAMMKVLFHMSFC